MKVLVGVGVVIRRDGKVLLGKRKGSHGASTWGLPGGHLEAGEAVEDCARRETAEETGLQIVRTVNAGFTNDIFAAENKHYVTLFVEADDPGGSPQLLEPDKCESWEWFSPGQLPEDLFIPFRTFVSQGHLASGSVLNDSLNPVKPGFTS